MLIDEKILSEALKMEDDSRKNHWCRCLPWWKGAVFPWIVVKNWWSSQWEFSRSYWAPCPLWPNSTRACNKIQVSQEKGKRLQTHYLSASSQNEFIGLCADYVRSCVLDELDGAICYSIIVNATADSSHVEHTTFIIRYLTRELETFIVQERFLTFVNCCKKIGLEISTLILDTFKRSQILLADYRGQGYDNAANMSGKCNGAKHHVLAENHLCLYLPCGCHPLKLCRADAAACCKEAVTFFGMVQTVYNVFSSSPQRWSIPRKKRILIAQPVRYKMDW